MNFPELSSFSIKETVSKVYPGREIRYELPSYLSEYEVTKLEYGQSYWLVQDNGLNSRLYILKGYVSSAIALVHCDKYSGITVYTKAAEQL